MITLSKDCLLFQLPTGESVPFSPEMISVELSGEISQWLDPEAASQAAMAVFHYFKAELGRQSVTAEEFAAAMERALQGLSRGDGPETPKPKGIIDADLRRLAQESSGGCELLFFPRLRNQVREHLRLSPRLVRYYGLRDCVKQIAGARRWTPRCQELEEQVVSFVRQCAGAEEARGDFALIVQ